MIVGLLIILAFILVLPFTFRFIEHNLEYYLFVMGIAAAITSGIFSWNLIAHILENHLLYFITAAVLITGLIFRWSVDKIKGAIGETIKHIPLKVFIFLLIVVLGLISSFVTAIIAALLLVEIVQALPLGHKNKTSLTIIACFSIGLGAALTPIGEPLATIVVSSLKGDFFYLLRTIGIYVISAIVALGIFGAFYIERRHGNGYVAKEAEGENQIDNESSEPAAVEKLQTVFIRALKIFIFVMALELLGAGFKPLIDTYIIHLDSRVLYWINMSSAVLDNATLAAAEVSPAMSLKQIQAILMGLLISGGMLVPGNIPNIISAGKLKIQSREWAVTGVPLGMVLLVVYFVVIFAI